MMNRCEIKSILEKHMKNYNNIPRHKYRDIVLSPFIENNKTIFQKTNKIKFIQMKIGIIWQAVLGTLPGVRDLGIGHNSSLDLKFTNKQGIKHIIELKNSYNTDNASSRAMNLQKLAKYVDTNKEYVAIYGIINDCRDHGQDKIIVFKDTKIRMLSGTCFLKFIFQDQDYRETVSILSEEINAFLIDSPI